jgi:hypothetical protein
VPGLYSLWDGKDGAAEQVDGYSGALSKSFKKYKKAVKWYEDNVDASSSESDSESDSSVASSSNSSVSSKKPRSKHRLKHRRSQRRSKGSVLPTSQVDKSEGTLSEVFGVSVSSTNLLKELCPGIPSEETRELLAEATIDASSLPATYSPSDTSIHLAELAGAVHDASSSRYSSKTKTPSRDVRYKSTGRNALGKISTVDQLYDATSGLQKIKKSVLEGMGVDMKGTLSKLCWSTEQLELFILVGRLPLMSRLSIDFFGQLLMYFQRVATSTVNGWELAKVDLDCFAEALKDIRFAASTRLMMIVKTYAYLRDAVASGFSTAELTDARHVYTMSAIASLREPLPAAAGTPRGVRIVPTPCLHCGQSGLHPIGAAECIFKSISRPKAKQAAREVTEKMSADPSLTVFPTCIAAVHSQNT